jgi:hypothetical protein
VLAEEPAKTLRWRLYPIRRGFVCAGEIATTDLAHPTLVAMKLGPPGQPLPHLRVIKDSQLFERDPGKEDAVRGRQLRKRSVLAIIGS